MSESRRRLHSTIWYLVPTGVSVLLPLLSLPVFTRVLAPAQYGAWVLATVYGALVTAVANFGMPISYERNFFEFRDGSRAAALLYSTLMFVAVLLALLLAVTWVLRERIASLVTQSAGQGLLVFWTACAMGLASLKNYFLLYLRNSDDARGYARYTMLENVLGVAASLVLVAVLRVGPVGLAWGPLAGAAVVLALLVGRFARRLSPAFDGAALMASLRISLPLSPRIIFGVVGTQFDKLIVGAVASAGGAAVYAIGQRLAHLVFTFMTALENSFQPLTYRAMFDGGDDGGRIAGTLLTPYAYASVAVALLIALGAEEAVAMLATPEYAFAWIIASILTIHFALMFFGKQPQLAFARRTDLTSLLSIVSMALSVGLTLVLARRAGALGAAAGTVLAGAVSVALFTAVGQRFYRIRYQRGPLAAMYTLLIIVALLLPLLEYWQVPYGARVACKAIAGASYLALGWKLGLIQRLRAALMTRSEAPV